MNDDEARAFLRDHQPMPAPLVDEGLIERYVAATTALRDCEDDEAVLLLIGSLSRGIGYFETVFDWALAKPHHAIVGAVMACMRRADLISVYWACQAAFEAPDPAFFDTLSEVLSSESADVRGAAAAALGELGPRGHGALRARLAVEDDPDVRDVIECALGERLVNVCRESQ